MTLIVPAYLKLYNIYHYAYIIGLINQFISALNGSSLPSLSLLKRQLLAFFHLTYTPSDKC